MKREKAPKSRKLYLALGLVYLLTVVAATVYSQTAYIDNLPAVELAISSSIVPRETLRQLPDGNWKVDTVERQEGPWGYKYVIKEVHTANPIPMEDQRLVQVFELMGNDNPLVVSCTGETYEGMEVRILKTADMPKEQWKARLRFGIFASQAGLSSILV